MKEIRNECEGCRTDGNCLLKMEMDRHNTREECPCKECLIKSMCSHACEIYGDIRQIVYGF